MKKIGVTLVFIPAHGDEEWSKRELLLQKEDLTRIAYYPPRNNTFFLSI